MTRKHVRLGAAAASAAAALMLLPAAAQAETPLEDLIGFPPGLVETRRMVDDGNAQFYVQEAGVDPADILGGVLAIPDTSRGGPQVILRATRFTSDEVARSVARTLASRDIGPVHELGSLRDGFIVTVTLPEFETTALYDGFRVRGRDVLSFALVSDQAAEPPAALIDYMRWHAATYSGGADAPLDPTGTRVPLVVALAAVLAAVAGLAVVVVRRTSPRSGPRPSRPGTGPTSQTWVG